MTWLREQSLKFFIVVTIFFLGNPGNHANDARQQKFCCLSLVQWASNVKRNLAALKGKSH